MEIHQDKKYQVKVDLLKHQKVVKNVIQKDCGLKMKYFKNIHFVQTKNTKGIFSVYEIYETILILIFFK